MAPLGAVKVIYNSEHLSVAGCLRNVLSQEPDKELAVRLRAANMTQDHPQSCTSSNST